MRPPGHPDSDTPSPRPLRGPAAEIRAFVTAALFQPVPRDHWQEPRAVRRRRVVSAVTLVIGAILLAVGLRFPPGDPRFYYATLALAAVWIVGAFASGPLHLGHAWTRRGHVGRPVVQSLALAALLVALFLAGAVVVARIPLLRGPVDELLDHAQWTRIGPSTPPVTRRCMPVTRPRRPAASTRSGTPEPRVRRM